MGTNAVLADPRYGVFRFDKAKHEYWLGDLLLPGLTGLLKSTGFIDTTWFKPEHTARGTWVHEVTHQLDENDLDWNQVPDDMMNWLAGWEGFKREFNFRITRREVPGFHKTLLYGTIPDAEGLTDHPDGLWKDQETIVEIKSGRVPFWGDLQTMGHKMMRESWDGPAVVDRKRVAVRLTSWGSFMPKVYTDDAVAAAVLRSAIICFRWKQQNGGSKNGNGNDPATCD